VNMMVDLRLMCILCHMICKVRIFSLCLNFCNFSFYLIGSRDVRFYWVGGSYHR
jgi:hypothetical protein